MGAPGVKVAAVVLNWKRADETIAAVRALRETAPEVEAIVVDNASGDGSAASIREACPHATVIENAENLGYAGGNNVGIRAVLARDAEAVLVLNNDVTVQPDAVRLLARALDADPALGIVAPVSLCRDDPGIVDFYRATIDLAHLAVHAHARDTRVADLRDTDTDYATGSAMLVRRELFERAGLFDERYFLVWEDVDFCLRARASGARVVVVADSRVLHGRSVSFGGEGSPLYQYFLVRNSFLLLATHLRGVRAWRARRLVARRYRGWITQPQTSEAAARAIARGLADGLAGRGGPAPDDLRAALSGSHIS